MCQLWRQMDAQNLCTTPGEFAEQGMGESGGRGRAISVRWQRRRSREGSRASSIGANERMGSRVGRKVGSRGGSSVGSGRPFIYVNLLSLCPFN